MNKLLVLLILALNLTDFEIKAQSPSPSPEPPSRDENQVAGIDEKTSVSRKKTAGYGRL